MYTGKSCTEFNILTGIPPCSEYPLGDCGRCRNRENAILTLKPMCFQVLGNEQLI